MWMCSYRARIRDAFGDVFAVFRKYDANRRGFLTAKEIRAVLEDLYLYVSDKQLDEILTRYEYSAYEFEQSNDMQLH